MIQLNQSYSLALYRDILLSLFGDDMTIFDTPRITPVRPYWKYIQRMDRIGEHAGIDLPIYTIVHASSNDPRVSLTREITRTLADTGQRRALIALYHTGSSVWRLSLVTIDLDIDEQDRIQRTYSNPRRYSFLLGEGEKTRTPTDSLLKKWKITDMKDLISRFSVEVVRKEFFDDYIDLFIRLYMAVSEDTWLMNVLKNESVDLVKFTKNLLGKIVFIYFIQKKWWLGLKRDDLWGNGDRDFMRSLWSRFASGDTFVRPSTENFYNDYLEHLFYNGFNKDRREDDAYDDVMRMKIPYLNGGLFKEDYKTWADFDAKISNDIFSNTTKTGILDIFDTYNFTIDEDDLYDSEVAVDPEMLGKIFEKMISVSRDNIGEIVSIYGQKWKIKIGTELNKEFGAFYTPREIVHYMTRESLIAYLSNGLKWSREENETRVRTLISAKDRHLSKAGDIDNEAELNTVLSIAEETDTLLQRVKILDPAVGSGAFPMGILHEISTLRYYLHSEGYCTTHHHESDDSSEELTEAWHISMYRIKRDTIKNSIYGVDIEPGAIDIARLRFWLSLVVDAEIPEPLPNFEFKFVAANTLIPLEAEITQDQLALDLGKNELNLRTLRRYMTDYYNTNSKTEKRKLEERITSYVTLDGTDEASQTSMADLSTPRRLQLAEFRPFDSNHSNPFFDPSLMMGEGRGFDIVIGNPPYGSNIDDQNILLRKLYSATTKGFTEIYKIFYERAYNLAKETWVVCYINPNTMLLQPRYADLREFLLSSQILQILNFWDGVFEDVVAPTCVFLSRKKNRTNNILEFFEMSKNGKFLWLDFSHREKIEQNNFLKNTGLLFSNQAWKNADCLTLDDILNFKDAWINYQRVKVWLGQKWNSDLSERLLYEWEFPEKPEHKEYWKWTDIDAYSILEKTNRFVRTDIKNSLRANERVVLNKEYFEIKPKIIWRQTASYPIVALDLKWVWFWRSIQWGTLKNEYINKISIKYVLALMNSRYLRYLYSQIVQEGGRIFPQVKLAKLKDLPIKNISLADQQPFITLVDAILSAKRVDPLSDTSAMEGQIDDMVYGLYGLTPEEIEIVEGR